MSKFQLIIRLNLKLLRLENYLFLLFILISFKFNFVSGTIKFNRNNKNKKKSNKATFYALISVIAFLTVSTLFGGNVRSGSMIKLSEFMSSAQNGQIEKAEVLNETVIGETKDGRRFKTFFPDLYEPI